MRHTLAFLVFASVALTGCTTVSPTERRAADEAACRDYGFRTGTDAFATCVQRIDLARQADRRADRLDNGLLYGSGVIGRPVLVR